MNLAERLAQPTHLATPDMIARFSQSMGSLAEKHYTNLEHENARKDCIRLSTLGHHPLHQISQWPSISEELGVDVEPVNEQLEAMFFWGGVFESWFEFTLERLGWEIIQPPSGEQIRVEFDGVTGHLDILARDFETGILHCFECKTMTSWKADKFAFLMDEYPQYQSQLATYTYCAQEMYGEKVVPMFAIFSMDKRATSLHPLLSGDYDYFITRAQRLIPELRKVTNLNSAIKLFPAPKAEPILFRKKWIDGEWMSLHSRLRYTPMPMIEKLYHVEIKPLKIGGKIKDVVVIGKGGETWYRD